MSHNISPVMAPRLLIAFLIILYVISSYGDSRQPAAIPEEQHYRKELEKRLQTLNKPPAKTIINNKETGDVMDCVRIDQQPAFDHPALKNHKIQLRPTFSPHDYLPLSSRTTSTKSLKSPSTGEEACPDGTVPIKRTTKEDLMRSDALLSKVLPASNDQKGDRTKRANVRLENQGKIHGSFSVMSVYNLSLAEDQESSSDIRLESGPPGQTDVINFGWKVSHGLNGDGLTRLFGFWHDYTNNKGCYNTLCPGFVQIDKTISINYASKHASVYGDYKHQWTFHLYILQDPNTGHWWLSLRGVDTINIGYWPKELFPSLGSGADSITWGGAVSPGSNGAYPPMGNGHLPDGLYKDTCHFHEVTYLNSSRDIAVPRQVDITANVDAPSYYYDLRFDPPHENLKIQGFSFMFGGPGDTSLTQEDGGYWVLACNIIVINVFVFLFYFLTLIIISIASINS